MSPDKLSWTQETTSGYTLVINNKNKKKMVDIKRANVGSKYHHFLPEKSLSILRRNLLKTFLKRKHEMMDSIIRVILFVLQNINFMPRCNVIYLTKHQGLG